MLDNSGMPIVPILIILFPAVEVYLLFGWIGQSPWVALPYLMTTMTVGFIFIRAAKVGFFELLRRLSAGDASPTVLLAVGKLWVIGVLLFFPGLLSDIAALLIALFFGKPAVAPLPEINARIIEDEPVER